ncbi:heme A synthase [Ktedonosporobacter rubrisoli]|uniref:Heme A synthase n=1 Tax=Ktedonosporobacter rubrisoli TaxID=2509675 RepID=A0A4P6JRB6_KTERU|nr:COX15/CtaA family protein [Ktedonosporobacter rubrisoli]QBD77740.1 heme A synthase [Ktedonosporobacter rubrisoli]
MIAHRLMKILAVITSIGAYLMLILGVLVTKTGSGQGCGNSWPFCHGEIIPGTITIAGVVEYSHRIMSSADGFLVLVLTICAWILYKRDFRVKLFAFMSLFFVLLQGALGALTVMYEGTFALKWLLSIHFGLSLIAFASVILLTIRLFQIDREQAGASKGPEAVRKLQYPALGLAIYTYIVVYTGALVAHTGAVTGCGYQIAGCGSTIFPNLTSLAGIQVLHRYGAGLLWLLVLGFLIFALRQARERRDVVRGAWWALILISLQAVSGIINVLTMGQLLAALLHTTLISIFFCELCYLCMQVGWPWKRRNQAAQKVEGSNWSSIQSRKGNSIRFCSLLYLVCDCS